MEEVKIAEEVQVVEAEETKKPKKEKKEKKKNAVTGKVFYKQVTVAIGNDEDNVVVQCIRLKGDEKLEKGDDIIVRGELRKRTDVLEFGNGCTFIKDENHTETDSEVVSTLKNLAENELYADGFCALTGKVTAIEKIPNETPQKTTYFIGSIAMFIVGVLYLLMADLTFKNTADRLIIAVLLSFGSAILFFLSSNFNEKPKIMYLFKGLGVALAIGFVVYIHIFSGSEFYLGVLDKFRKAGISGESDLIASQATIVVTLILGYVSIVGQCANTVLEAVIKQN